MSDGPVSRQLGDRRPFGAMERLEHDRLGAEQQVTLASPRRDYWAPSRALFTFMDLAYGPHRTLAKFRILELIARVPYQAWENVAYVAVTHTAERPRLARRIFDRVRLARWEQDNEQWHLLILEEQLEDERRPLVMHQLVPQVVAFVYYWLSWITYIVQPAWSYRLNADFEDHAEHEYALLVSEHPEWETTAFESDFTADFGEFESLADVFRQIGYDERMHRLESEANIEQPRFA